MSRYHSYGSVLQGFFLHTDFFQKWARNNSCPNRRSNLMLLFSIFFHNTQVFGSNLCWLITGMGLLWIWNIHCASDTFSNLLDAYGDDEPVQSHETCKPCCCLCGISVHGYACICIQLDQMGMHDFCRSPKSLSSHSWSCLPASHVGAQRSDFD